MASGCCANGPASGHVIDLRCLAVAEAGALITFGLSRRLRRLAQEVAQFGIKVTLVEPGGFSTDWAGASAVHAAPHDAYQGLHDQMAANAGRTKSGHPTATGPALLQIVDADNPPLRVFFGSMPLQLIDGLYAKRLATWKEWEKTSIAAEG